MAIKTSFPLVEMASKTATWTSTPKRDNYSLRNVELMLRVAAGGSTGTSPTLDVRVQGAPTNSASLYTSIMRESLVGSGPVAKTCAFTQATTAVTQRFFVQYWPRWARVVSTHGGSSPSFTYGLWVSGEEG